MEDSKLYITMPIIEWEGCKTRIQWLEDQVKSLGGKEDVILVNFDSISTSLGWIRKLEVYTKEEFIKGMAEREKFIKEQLDGLYLELEGYKSKKKWWQFWK